MSNWKVVTEEPVAQNTPMQSNWKVVPYEDNQESLWKRIPRDVLIGLTHAGRNLHNLPHDIAHLGDVVGSKIGRMLGAPELQNKDSDLASYLPYDEQNYADVWGQKGPGTTLDNVLQKGVEIAPDVIGGVNALRSLKILPHLTRKGASKNIVKARELGKTRNMGPLDVNPDLIEDTRQFLPNTTPYRNLIDEAGYGDYNKLFSLQSDLGKHAGGMSKDWFSKANRAHGRAGLEVRGNILNEMKNSMRQQGHGDIADLLSKGQDEYRRYMKFKPYRNALLAAGAAYSLPRNVLIDLAKKFATMSKD
jgi:hypothetical protein